MTKSARVSLSYYNLYRYVGTKWDDFIRGGVHLVECRSPTRVFGGNFGHDGFLEPHVWRHTRFRGDVAQASVSFHPITVTVGGVSEFSLAVVPQMPSVTARYVPSGEQIEVTTGHSPRGSLSGGLLRATLQYTTTIDSRTFSGTVSPTKRDV